MRVPRLNFKKKSPLSETTVLMGQSCYLLLPGKKKLALPDIIFLLVTREVSCSHLHSQKRLKRRFGCRCVYAGRSLSPAVGPVILVVCRLRITVIELSSYVLWVQWGKGQSEFQVFLLVLSFFHRFRCHLHHEFLDGAKGQSMYHPFKLPVVVVVVVVVVVSSSSLLFVDVVVCCCSYLLVCFWFVRVFFPSLF